MSLLSRAAYARHRGVDASLVTRWAQAGRIVVDPDGKRIDAEASDAMLAETLDPARGGRGGKSDRMPEQAAPPAAKPAAAPASDTYNRVRTHREAFAAKTSEAVYRKMIGELVEREPYNRAWVQNLGPALQRLDTISARLGARLAAETDVRKCQDMLDDEIVAIRQEIADNAQAMIEGAGKTKQ